jgi:hypothetical protein
VTMAAQGSSSGLGGSSKANLLRLEVAWVRQRPSPRSRGRFVLGLAHQMGRGDVTRYENLGPHFHAYSLLSSVPPGTR